MLIVPGRQARDAAARGRLCPGRGGRRGALGWHAPALKGVHARMRPLARAGLSVPPTRRSSTRAPGRSFRDDPDVSAARALRDGVDGRQLVRACGDGRGPGPATGSAARRHGGWRQRYDDRGCARAWRRLRPPDPPPQDHGIFVTCRRDAIAPAFAVPPAHRAAVPLDVSIERVRSRGSILGNQQR